jgi:hypothetical protein
MWCSVFLILMTHLLYFNSGAIQFGYRFSLDFVPLIVLLLGYTLKEGLEKIGYILISYGFCINVIGAIWIARRWCENW